MAISSGKTGRGIAFQISNGASPPVWLSIANATSINNSGRDAEEIDFTHLLSTGGFRENRQGFKDPGSISIEYHFTPTEASHVELLDLWNSGAVFDWRIDFTSAGWDVYFQGQGYVKNPGDISIAVNDPITASSTIRVTGETSFEDA